MLSLACDLEQVPITMTTMLLYLTISTVCLITMFQMFLLSQENNFGTVRKCVKFSKIYDDLQGRTHELNIQYIVNRKDREPRGEPASVQLISIHSGICRNRGCSKELLSSGASAKSSEST